MSTSDPIKVMMLSTSYPADSLDWKGTFIRNMLEALANNGSVELSVWQPAGEIPLNVRECMSTSDSQWLARLLDSGGIAHQLRTSPVKGVISAAKLIGRMRQACLRETQTDLWHVNWLQNALAVPSDRKGLVTTALGMDLALLKIPGIVWQLRRKFRNRKTVICPNSRWMEKNLKEHFGDVSEIQYLPFGIDEKWYQVLRTPSKRKRWLCVTRITPEKIGDLFDWSHSIFTQSELELHLIGPNQSGLKIPDWIHYHGSVSPNALRQNWFSSSTGLITLSRHSEGRPQVMMEAMASGMPVIASDLIAHADFIDHGKTGWICSDKETFVNGIKILSKEQNNKKIGENARHSIRSISGNWSTYTNRLFEIYSSIA